MSFRSQLTIASSTSLPGTIKIDGPQASNVQGSSKLMEQAATTPIMTLKNRVYAPIMSTKEKEKGQLRACNNKVTKSVIEKQKEALIQQKTKTTPTTPPISSTLGVSNLSYSDNIEVIGSSQSDQQGKNIGPIFGPFQPSIKTSSNKPPTSVSEHVPCKLLVPPQTSKMTTHNLARNMPLSKVGTKNSTFQSLVPKGRDVISSKHELPFSSKLSETLLSKKLQKNSLVDASKGQPQQPNAHENNLPNTVQMVGDPKSTLKPNETVDGDNITRCGMKKRRYRETSGKVTWSDDIEADPDEVVEVEEKQENGPPRLGILEGSIPARQIWHFSVGRRIKVHFNEFDQPIRKGALALVHFLSEISKNGSYCPIGEKSWKTVDKHFKSKVVDIVREKFVLPNRREIDERILTYVNQKWKNYRWELHQKYYRPNINKERMMQSIPENVIEEQWIKLVNYWFSDQFKNLSNKGKKARCFQAHQRTTGSKSYAQKRIEFDVLMNFKK